VCFEVDDVDRDLGVLRENGIELIDQQPRLGIAGRICFLHPRALGGALVELCQPVEAEHEAVAP
jgi:methylmalonyl-CoA/ethylmalonyl-CoA epimerase